MTDPKTPYAIPHKPEIYANAYNVEYDARGVPHYKILGRTEGRPNGYPAWRCTYCLTIWHLPQQVRWSFKTTRSDLFAARAHARDAGWKFDPIRCPECAKDEV